jgi:hypothetical protein
VGTAAAAGTSPTFSHSNQITNPYLPITKFHRCELAGNDEGQHLRIVRTLLDRTEPFTYAGQSLNAAVVRDRVVDVKAHQLIEKTIDYFAQDDAGAVYYLGEDVNEYKRGKLVTHEGQWRLGRDTQVAGILMPASPKVGDVFKSEDVPGIIEETSNVIALGGKSTIDGHKYSNVLRIREDVTAPTTETEFKRYAPGTGVVTEANGGVKLVSCH